MMSRVTVPCTTVSLCSSADLCTAVHVIAPVWCLVVVGPCNAAHCRSVVGQVLVGHVTIGIACHAPTMQLTAPEVYYCTMQLAILRTTQHSQNQHIQYTYNLHCAPLLGIGSGHRQLIAVTCIAEYA